MFPIKLYEVPDQNGKIESFTKLREAKQYAKKVAATYPDKKAYIDITIQYDENDFGEGIIDYIEVKAN